MTSLELINKEQQREQLSNRRAVSRLDRAASSKRIESMAEPGLLSEQELIANQIIFPELEQQSIVDVYRELRTKILQFSGGENRITMVTSVRKGGGASHIALNLAAAFAFDEAKTSLLIDCNVRNPVLHKRLHLSPQYGLTDFLESDSIALDNIVFATGIARMRLVPVGQRREASSEYFTSLRMRALLDVLKLRYQDRYLFVDGPPIGENADARILANLVDQVLLVVPYGQVTSRAVEQAVDAIDRSKLIGVVVNSRA